MIMYEFLGYSIYNINNSVCLHSMAWIFIKRVNANFLFFRSKINNLESKIWDEITLAADLKKQEKNAD